MSARTPDYLTSLGYTPAGTSVRNGRKVSIAQCDHCEQVVTSEGPILRGHRRHCSVFSADPYTPGVCDA